MIKRRRPPSYLPGSHQQQQQGLGSCLEVGQFGGGGLDEEMDRLKRDKNILLAEVVKLRQEQQSTRADMRAMEERLQHAEHKQVQMMGTRTSSSTCSSTMTSERSSTTPSPRRSGGGPSTPRRGLFGELGSSETGTSELENLALNIQGLGKRKPQDEKQSGGETAELTDDFWEQLLSEGMRGGDSGTTATPELERRQRPGRYVDALAQRRMSSMSNRTPE
nr:unnamed protein product [Digitaria exilis]